MADECREIIEVAEGPSVCASAETQHAHPRVAVQQESAYGIKVWIQKPYDEVIQSTRRAIAHEGLSIVKQIDVREMLEAEFGTATSPYDILGVSKPEWMRQALDLDKDVGLLLPFNLVVYEQSNGTVLEAVDPIALMAIAGGEGLTNLARVMKQSLQDIINHVASGVD